MRLVCPSCAAQYEIPDEAVPEEGREVQCGTCSTSWFQERPVAEESEAAPRTEEPAAGIERAPDAPEAPREAAELSEGEFKSSDAADTAESPAESDSEKTVVAATAPREEAPTEEAQSEPELPPEPEKAEPEPEPKQVTEAASEASTQPAEQQGSKKTQQTGGDLDFDFDFDFEEDDEPAPVLAAATPEPVEEETAKTAQFDKSLHSSPTDGRPKSPSWAKEEPQTSKPEPEPEPENLSAPDEPALGEDDDDLLAAVRGELDKLEDTPAGRDVPGPGSKLTGVAAAAASSGIVFDNDFEEVDDFSAVAQELGETLQQDKLEDLSAPETKGAGPKFSIGFVTSAILFAMAYAAYLLGPSIAESVPSAAPYLTRYTQIVDQTRRIVEELSGNALGFAEDKMNESDGS